MHRAFLHIALLMVLFSKATQAQTLVALPDTAFARCVRAHWPDAIDAASGKLIVATAKAKTGRLRWTDGNIRYPEGLQYFTNLSIIELQENDMDTLPHLGNLTKLTKLDVRHNRLRHLPGVEKLVALEYLYAWSNRLLEVPSLAALPNLIECCLFYNDLRKAPEMGAKPKLKLLYLNDNDLTELSDFSGCTVVENVRLYNNPLTFRQLLKLRGYWPNYRSLVKLTYLDQMPEIGKDQHVQGKESDTLRLSTFLDRGVDSVSYTWFRNGQPLATTSYDTLLLPSLRFEEAGSYVCKLSHPAFPQFTINTDTFQVQVLPCLLVQEITVSATDINCLQTGTVVATTNGQAVRAYELEGIASGKKQVSTSGTFTGLSEPAYTLYITTPNGCRKAYPSTITLHQKDCDEVLISPDNDGNGDSYFFTESGKVNIYDKRGNLVKTLSIPGAWDGSSDKGKVFSGFYVADINNGARLLGITVLY